MEGSTPKLLSAMCNFDKQIQVALVVLLPSDYGSEYTQIRDAVLFRDAAKLASLTFQFFQRHRR